MSITEISSPIAKEGSLAQLRGEKGQDFIIKLTSGESFQSHLGVIEHEELIGKPWGTRVETHKGKTFHIFQPALDDLLRNIDRHTQIVYPKDVGYIILSLGVGAGSKVIEAGTGSGALTTAFAFVVGENGQVYSYENREKHQKIAKENLERFGLESRVTFHLQDIEEGFFENNIPSLFLDLQNPQDYISQVYDALSPGGIFGSIIPTTNQVSDLITALKKSGFGFIEVSEVLHRYYKPSATRLRPADSMNAHTGFLVFARRLTSIIEASQFQE